MITLNIKAKDVNVSASYGQNVNLSVDIPDTEIDTILDSLDKNAIAEYMISNGFVCEIE